MDPLDLVKRIRKVPVDPLVDVLRELHRRGDAAAGAAPALEALERTGREPGAGASALAPFLGLLQRAIASTPAPEAADPAATESGYDRVRAHFQRHETALRRQALLTDTLLEELHGKRGTVESTSTALQQELALRCPVGDRSAGRFVLVNELDRSVQCEFEVQGLGAGAVAIARRVSLTPAKPRLAPGAETLVRLRVDLAPGEARPGEEIELVVDVRAGASLLLKLWVRVEAVAPLAPEDDGLE